MDQKRKNLPLRVYTIPAFFLAVCGLIISIYLAVSHYRNYTDLTYSSFCAISQSINCDTVAQSPWSILFNIPIAAWGIFAYFLFLFILLFATKSSNKPAKLWSLLFIYSLFLSCFSLFFGYISAFKIQSFCILCLVSYTINFLLSFNTWIIRRRFDEICFLTSIKQNFSILLANMHIKLGLCAIIFFLISAVLFYPRYWEYSPATATFDLPSGITADGSPWIGAENPLITIEEFSDYQCFQCKKIHFHLRSLVIKYPNNIRLVHHHYPMDHEFNTILVKKPFHLGSGRLALFAIAASQQNKFWEVNDAIYSLVAQKQEEFDLLKLSKKLDLDTERVQQDMYSTVTLKILENNIKKGLKNNIMGTPSFIINEQVYRGHIPTKIFEGISNDQFYH